MDTRKKLRIVKKRTACILVDITEEEWKRRCKEREVFKTNLASTFLSICLGNIVNYFVRIDKEIDLIALEIVLRLKEVFPFLYIVVVPTNKCQEKKWSKRGQEKYALLLEQCNEIRMVVSHTLPCEMDGINKWLIDHARVCVICEDSKGECHFALSQEFIQSGKILRVANFE